MIKLLRNFFCSIRKDVESKEPLVLGKALTKAFLALVAVLAFLPQYTPENGWSLRVFSLLMSPANEIGDTFAGVAGVLAFLWIIVTVWLQSQELSEQREELRLTRLEMAEQRKATQDMARAMSAQAKVFEDEQRQRIEVRAGQEMRELVQSVHELSEPHGHIQWKYYRETNGSRVEYEITLFDDWLNDDTTAFKALPFMAGEVEDNVPYIIEKENEIVTRPSRSEFPEAIMERLEKLEALFVELSAADKEKFKRAKIPELKNALSQSLQEKIWAEDFS